MIGSEGNTLLLGPYLKIFVLIFELYDFFCYRCALWVKHCANEMVFSKSITKLHKHYHVCSGHFLDSDFRGNEKKSLKPHAVPSLNLPVPFSDDRLKAYLGRIELQDGKLCLVMYILIL
jgi:hypothetical protein